MIHLTRLNGNPLVVNSDLIKYAESSPDTMLTLLNGEKIVVLESCEEVIARTIAYRARVSAQASAQAGSDAAPSGAPVAVEPGSAQPTSLPDAEE